MKAINILWDTDSNQEVLEQLPKEIEIPEDITDEDEISDYISDVTGYCHCGFNLIDTYEYEIFLDDLKHGSLVGDNGEHYFHSKKAAIEDAKDYINKHLMDEYKREEKDFRILVYKID